MNTTFGFRSMLAVTVGSLALASAVQAGPLSDAIRTAQSENDSSSPAPAPPSRASSTPSSRCEKVSELRTRRKQELLTCAHPVLLCNRILPVLAFL